MKRTLGAGLLVASLALSTTCRSTPPGFHSPVAATPASTGESGGPLDGVPSMDRPTPLDPAIRHGQLANGLTYYVLRHPVPERRAALRLAVKAGSLLEDDDQRGVAHLVEHMAFRGTRRFPGKAILDFLQSIGMALGPDFNASTDFDETEYQLNLPTDDASVLLKGLDILRDIAGDVTFIAADVEKERHSVLEEWRSGNVASSRRIDLLLPVFLRGSRYADRRPIGTPESISSVPPSALTRFYTDWYRPDRMAVIAVGDFADADVETAIRARFGDLIRPTKRDPGPVAIPASPGLGVAVTTDPEATSSSVMVFQKTERRRNETERDYRRELDQTLLANIMDSRLAELRDRPESPIVESSVKRNNFISSTDTRIWSVTAKEARVADAVRLVIGEIARVEQNGVLATEVAREGAALLVSAERHARENDKLPARDFVDELVAHFRFHKQVPGPATEVRWLRELLPLITVEEMRTAATMWGWDQGQTVVISGPRGASLPRAEQFRAVIEDAHSTTMWPRIYEPFDGPLLAQKPASGQVVESSWDQGAEATVWRLANGVKIVVKATAFENDWIRVGGSQPGGGARIADKDSSQARFAAEILDESGAGELSELEIWKALTGKDVRVNVGLSDSYQEVTAETRPEDLETMLQLIHLRLLYPRKSDYAFEVWKAQRIEAERRRLASPDERMNNEMSITLYGNHPWHRPVTIEDIQRVQLNRVFEIWKERFADFNGFTFVFVGNVDLEKLRPLVETYLGSLPSGDRREHTGDPRIPYPRTTIERVVAGGTEARSWVWICFTAPEHWSIDAVRDGMILKTVLDIRLYEVLRQKTGAVYAMEWSVDLSREPTERHFLSVLFACAPENVDALREAVLAELAEIARNGVGREYLDKAAARIRKQHETDLKDNEWWLAQLRDAYQHGDDFATVKNVDAVLARITSERLKATAARMVLGKPHIAVSLRPAAPAPAPASK